MAWNNVGGFESGLLLTHDFGPFTRLAILHLLIFPELPQPLPDLQPLLESLHPADRGSAVIVCLWARQCLRFAWRVRKRAQICQSKHLGCSQNDSEGIRTPAGRAQWISSPSPLPLGHTVYVEQDNKAQFMFNYLTQW